MAMMRTVTVIRFRMVNLRIRFLPNKQSFDLLRLSIPSTVLIICKRNGKSTPQAEVL